MGDLTLFEAQAGGAFDRLTSKIAGNLTKIFQKSHMPWGFPWGGGGMGGFGSDRYISCLFLASSACKSNVFDDTDGIIAFFQMSIKT